MNVKLMLSGVLAASCAGLLAVYGLCALLSITLQQKRLDKITVLVVIIFTAATQPNRENENAPGENQLRQAEGVTATRNTQPPPAGCAPSSIPEQRILRSQRLAAGEIRDATTGPCGHEDEVLPGTENADQPTEEMSKRHDHGKNCSGKIRIELCAKSFILQVYDVLAKHNRTLYCFKVRRTNVEVAKPPALR